MSTQKISAIVIAKNEQSMIANCLDTLNWCDARIVVDNGSTDDTVELAKRSGATVVSLPGASLPKMRNAGMERAKGDWLLYIDADERVTPKLKSAIMQAASAPGYSAYTLSRNNIHQGKWMRYGGWEHDAVVRLFRVGKLEKWEGDVHEHAVVVGEVGAIAEPLVHLTHRNFLDGLKKSIEWTPIEARLLHNAGHPRMTTLRFMKVVLDEFLKRFLFKKGWKDGVEGGIEAMVQAMNRFFVYVQLWELQRQPPLAQTYEKIEKEIAHLWQKEHA